MKHMTKGDKTEIALLVAITLGWFAAQFAVNSMFWAEQDAAIAEADAALASSAEVTE